MLLIHALWIIPLLLLAASAWTLLHDRRIDRARPLRQQADPWRRRVTWMAWALLAFAMVCCIGLIIRGPMSVITSKVSVWFARLYLLGTVLAMFGAPFGIRMTRWLLIVAGLLLLLFLFVLGMNV